MRILEMQAAFCPTWANSARSRPRSAESGSDLAEMGPTPVETRARCAKCWAISATSERLTRSRPLAAHRPESTNADRDSTNIGRNSTNFGRMLAKLGSPAANVYPTWLGSGNTWIGVDQTWSEIVQILHELDKHLARIRPHSNNTGSAMANFRPNSTKHGPQGRRNDDRLVLRDRLWAFCFSPSPGPHRFVVGTCRASGACGVLVGRPMPLTERNSNMKHPQLAFYTAFLHSFVMISASLERPAMAETTLSPLCG